MMDMTESERHALRFSTHCQEAEALHCAAEILGRWESLGGIAHELEQIAEHFESRAEAERKLI